MTVARGGPRRRRERGRTRRRGSRRYGSRSTSLSRPRSGSTICRGPRRCHAARRRPRSNGPWRDRRRREACSRRPGAGGRRPPAPPQPHLARAWTGPPTCWRSPARERPSGAASERPRRGAPAGAPVELGGIAIAHGTARRDALEAGRAFESHLSHLVVHGALHLLGYDHGTSAGGPDHGGPGRRRAGDPRGRRIPTAEEVPVAERTSGAAASQAGLTGWLRRLIGGAQRRQPARRRRGAARCRRGRRRAPVPGPSAACCSTCWNSANSGRRRHGAARRYRGGGRSRDDRPGGRDDAPAGPLAPAGLSRHGWTMSSAWFTSGTCSTIGASRRPAPRSPPCCAGCCSCPRPCR